MNDMMTLQTRRLTESKRKQEEREAIIHFMNRMHFMKAFLPFYWLWEKAVSFTSQPLKSNIAC